MEQDFYNTMADKYLGIPYVYPYQRLVIHHLLAVQGYWGEELAQETPDRNLVILPTGSGKSLCFMLPGMMLEGITVVVYPLLSLMKDQFRRFLEQNVPVAMLKGGMSVEEKQILGRQIEKGNIQFLLTNPEMCQSTVFQSWAGKKYFCQLIIDEVHTVLQWGLTFRPALMDIRSILQHSWFRGVHLFTATLSESGTKQLKYLISPDCDWNVIRSCGDRENLRYFFISVYSINAALEELCRRRKGATLIFCNSRKSSEETARMLRTRLNRKDIQFYHAGMNNELKKQQEQWFFQSKEGILCSTTAYGMGVDKSDIRMVIHRDLPGSPEAFLQEAGRAGRDREQADSIVLLPEKNNDKPVGFATQIKNAAGCRRYAIMESMGETINQCGGCDFCTPENWIPSNQENLNLINGFIKKFAHLHKIQDIQDILSGFYSPGVIRNQWFLIKEFGILKDLDVDDLLETIKKLKPPLNKLIKILLRFIS